jgi:CPA2 family monovalent cation:H+ antiporter-2
MFDSSLRAGRYVLENIGLSEYEAAEAERVFYHHDRDTLRQLAELWRADIPTSKNTDYIERAKALQRDLETALLTRSNKDRGAR